MFLVTSDFEHISILRSVVIQVIVSAWVLIPLANHSHTILLLPQSLKNLTSPPDRLKALIISIL